MKLSKDNRKIKGALIWNLPTVQTCPGRTKMCEKICYAQAAEKVYKNARNCRQTNYLESSNHNFAKKMTAMLKRSKTKYVRIHESGDFYNQDYLNSWVEIIKACPKKQFFAFTKSHMLNWSKAKKLLNFNVRYSIDKTSEHILPGVSLALISDVKKKGFFTCPGTASDGEPKCIRDCKVCVETDKNVRFHLHGPNKNK